MKTIFKTIIFSFLFFCSSVYADTISITWDQPVTQNLKAFDLRINEDNATIINISKDVRIWCGNVTLQDGQNILDMRAINEADEKSVWSIPCYYDVNSEIISQSLWKLHYVDSEELMGEEGSAVNAFDGDNSTIWHTEWESDVPTHPHEIQIDTGDIYKINEFKYLPRLEHVNGRIGQYEFYVSLDGSNWGTPVATGTFINDASEKEITFPAVVCRFIRLKALTEVNNRAWTSVAELNIKGYRITDISSPRGVTIIIN